MPRIPTYQRQNTVSGQSPNVTGNNGGSLVAGAAAGFGQALTGLADTVIQRQQEIKKQELHDSTLIIGNAINDEALNFNKSGLERKEQDAYGSMELTDEWKKAITEKYTKDITDERQKFEISQHIESQALKIKNSLSTHEAGQRKVVSENTRVNTLALATKSAYQGFGTLDDNLKIFNTAIVNDPTLGETERENKLIAGQSAVADAYLDGVVNRSPVAAVELIKSGVFSQYLDKSKIEAHDKKANELIKAEERDAKTAEIESKRLAKEQLEIQRQMVNKDLVDLEVGGKLTRKTIAKYKDVLNENEYRQWFDRIDAREEKAKKALKDGESSEFKTNKALDGKFYRRIVMDPESVSEAEILDSIGSGLSRESAKTLIDERTKRIKGDIDPAFAAGERAVIENLKRDRKAGLFGEGQKGDAEYAKHTEALKRWMKSHPKEDPSDYYEKLTEPNKTGFITGVLDNVLMGFYDPEKPDVNKRRDELAGSEKKTLAIGTVQKGYKFKGGDPSKKTSWEKVK